MVLAKKRATPKHGFRSLNKMSQLPPLESFDCEGDAACVGLRWEKWKRGFEIFLLASNITDGEKKRATLLHVGGLPLQEIYYNIPDVDQSGNDTDLYKIAIKKLDDYFSPKQSKTYERHLFRLLKQEPGEKFDKFLLRLRRQGAKCKFSNEQDNLIDQIVEKCSSKELRKKILTLGDDVNLDQIVTSANAIEAVDRQLNGYDLPNQETPITTINKIAEKSNNSKNNPCFRCGKGNHTGDSDSCPAKSKQCLKCGFVGHFRSQCKTRASKRKPANEITNGNPSKKFKFTAKDGGNKLTTAANKDPIPIEKKSKTNIDYIFHLDDDTILTCNLGGVVIDMIIDSGSKCNILSDKTWNYLKSSRAVVRNQVANPGRTFMAYGSDKPLTVIGAFDAEIGVRDQSQVATFYVIKDGTRDLLGKDTAMLLGVLKLGLEVNQVSVSNFPKIKDLQLNISIDKTVKPKTQPYRRVPIPLEDKINKKIDELVKLDIIEPIRKPSGWVSPIVPVLKPNNDVRLCVDMRCANEAILRENHPLPTMDQLLPKFNKARVFSKLDIKDAFHQVEISEESRDITTFITSKGLYRYKRLMFGISCAPEYFQKILESILLPCDGVVNFIDDIVVYGSNDTEHNHRLKRVLEVLRENHILLNQGKCVFNVSNIEFLGHELSAQGVKPLDKYRKVIDDFREPSTVEEVQSFLGLINYVNKWIPDMATKSEPLRRLLCLKLGKNADIKSQWGPEQNKSFQELKTALSNIQTLGYYDPKDKTTVMADASPVGLGAVLIQSDNNGPRVIAYGNKSLTDVEKRYCQTEKEALALVWAVEHFKMYLYGKESFDLVTDHKPLEVIFGKRSKPCARIERWVLRLQTYNFKVIYKPGKTNIADCLSRLCTTCNAQPFDNEYHINQIVQLAKPSAIGMDQIVETSLRDKEIQLVKQALTTEHWDSSVSNVYRAFQTELWVHDSLLLRGNKIVIPHELRQQVLEAAHEGHPGIVAMKARLRTKVWWPKIDADAEKAVKSCKGCTLVSAPNPPMPMKRRELPSQAWVDVAIDFLGPLPSEHYLFVIVDYYSRYKEIKPMKNITSGETIKVLKEIFSRLGTPVSVTTDNGKQFISNEFKAFCQELGIKQFFTTPYSPQQNGEVERQNRDILKRLRISQSQKSNWLDDLLLYLTMYNSTPHSTTGKTPSELFFCRQFRDKIPSLKDIDSPFVADFRDKDKIMKEKGKDYGDRKRKACDSGLGIGEKVYVKNMVKTNKLTTNFNPASHTVVDSKGPEYCLKNDETGQEIKRNIIHLKRVEGQWRVEKDESEYGSNGDSSESS